MREWDTLYNLAPPPPSPPPKNNFPMLYYGLVVVGAAAIVLAIYNLIIVKWCASQQRQQHDTNVALEVASLSRRSLDSSSIKKLGTSFKYKKGEEILKLGYDNQECPVCLSIFVEGEEVKQLPSCRHSFHAPCIDMWLCSHLDCPLCRSPVEPPDVGQSTSENENSREVLVDPRVHV